MDWKKYNKKFYDEPNDVLRTENNYITNLFKTLNLENKQCLDFGCGPGYWISLFLEMGAVVTAADISDNTLNQYQMSYPNCNFIHLKGEALPFNDTFFDIIFVAWVLQELCDDIQLKKCIKELSRILKFNGRLIIVENIYPDKRMLYKSTEIGDIYYNKGNPKFLRFFPDNTLSKILLKISDLKRCSYDLRGHSFFEIYKK